MESDFFFRGLKYCLQDRGVSSKFSSHSIFRVQPINAAFRGRETGGLFPAVLPIRLSRFNFFSLQVFGKIKKAASVPALRPSRLNFTPKNALRFQLFLCVFRIILCFLYGYMPPLALELYRKKTQRISRRAQRAF